MVIIAGFYGQSTCVIFTNCRLTDWFGLHLPPAGKVRYNGLWCEETITTGFYVFVQKVVQIIMVE